MVGLVGLLLGVELILQLLDLFLVVFHLEGEEVDLLGLLGECLIQCLKLLVFNVLPLSLLLVLLLERDNLVLMHMLEFPFVFLKF